VIGTGRLRIEYLKQIVIDMGKELKRVKGIKLQERSMEKCSKQIKRLKKHRRQM